MNVLGIETSCDETAVAIVSVEPQGRLKILGQQVASQVKFHRNWGGVVPEVAVRQHLLALEPLLDRLWQETGLEMIKIGGVGITRGPGLSPALMTGWCFGRALALAAGCPWVGVNHLCGHLYSPFLREGTLPDEDHVALIVSGGHTLFLRMDSARRIERLGGTVDDAVGEAFDKVAKMLGLPYPGGPEIEKMARQGNPAAVDFPRSMIHSGDLRLSFSGLKTSVRVYLNRLGQPPYDPEIVSQVAASFQAAVIEVLISKWEIAIEQTGVRCVTLSGGVACNQALRAAAQEMARRRKLRLLMADPALSTDNAAMIATVAASLLLQGQRGDWAEDFDPNLSLESVC